jgi:hypothetical protein
MPGGKMYFLFTESNPKTMKGEALGYYTVVLHMIPWKYSGHQVCAMADGCEKDCLAFSGRGAMDKTVMARMRRTKAFFDDRDRFMAMMKYDIQTAQEKAKAKEMTLVVRPNGTSDIPWEKIRMASHRNIFEAFPDVQFMDYTKYHKRSVPENYHLTFSLDDHNHDVGKVWLDSGRNVSLIYDDEMPLTWNQYPTIDGDVTDLRFLDPSPRVVALRRKATRLPNYWKEAA